MRVALFYNPSAGNEDHSPEALAATLRRAGYEPVAFELDARDKDALLRGCEFVIAAGGDGSVRKAALALLDCGRPLAPLPLGTANNIARTLGIRGSPEEIVAGWRSGIRRKFDVGVVSGPEGRRHFLESVGFGLVGRAISVIEDIDEASAREFRTREEKLHRDLCVLAALAHEIPSAPMELALDGAAEKDRYLFLEVFNIGHGGPGVEFAPGADPSDGVLDVVAIRRQDRTMLLNRFKEALAGSESFAPLDFRRARRVRVAAENCVLHVDDQVFRLANSTSIEIGLQPGRLELVLPEAARTARGASAA